MTRTWRSVVACSGHSEPSRITDTPQRHAQWQTLTPEQRQQWSAIGAAMAHHNGIAAARLEFWRLYQSRIELTPRDWK